MCANPRCWTASPRVATTRRADSRATSPSSLTTTSCAPPKRSSATDQPHRADEGAFEDAIKTGRIERFGDERRLIEWLEAARATRYLRAVPVGCCQQVVLLPRYPSADRGARTDGLEIDADERPRRPRRSVEGRAHGAKLDL